MQDMFASFPVGRRNCRLPCNWIYAQLRIRTLSVQLKVVIRKDPLCIWIKYKKNAICIAPYQLRERNIARLKGCAFGTFFHKMSLIYCVYILVCITHPIPLALIFVYLIVSYICFYQKAMTTAFIYSSYKDEPCVSN